MERDALCPFDLRQGRLPLAFISSGGLICGDEPNREVVGVAAVLGELQGLWRWGREDRRRGVSILCQKPNRNHLACGKLLLLCGILERVIYHLDIPDLLKG